MPKSSPEFTPQAPVGPFNCTAEQASVLIRIANQELDAELVEDEPSK